MGAPGLVLTYNSRLTFPGAYNNSRIASVGDSIRFALPGAIARYAGHQGPGTGIDSSLQDKVLSDPNLVADKAQRAYVSKRWTAYNTI